MTRPVGWREEGKETIIIIDCIIKNVLQFLFESSHASYNCLFLMRELIGMQRNTKNRCITDYIFIWLKH